MNRQKCLVFVAVLALVAGSAGWLLRLKATQRLGLPGLKVTRVSGSQALQIQLPGQVLDYTSKAIEPFPEEVATLPKDTTFGRRLYASRDGSQILLSVVLMGSDRTSIHRPQFCLTGQGWSLEPEEMVSVPVEKPRYYELPVMRIVASRQFTVNGQPVNRRGIYAYWFVSDKRVTASAGERMRWMAGDLLRTGVLQRWAYVSCLTDCAPGDEKAAFFRLQQFIAAAVPEFQLATPPENQARLAFSEGQDPAGREK